MPSLSQKTFYQVLAIVILTFGAYAFMLQNDFKTQDHAVSIVLNQDIHNFSHIGKIISSSLYGKGYYYRPLVLISYMVDYHFFGLNAFNYYLVNIFLHIATALVVFWLMRQVFRKDSLSFAAALLFAIHPIHWEAISNISGRGTLLNAFFLTSAFGVFIMAQKRKRLFPLALFLFFLALMSHEAAAIFPLVLFCYQFIFNTRRKLK